MKKDQQPSYHQLLKIAKLIPGELQKMQSDPKWKKFSNKPCDMYTMEFDGRIASKGVHTLNFCMQQIVQFINQVGSGKQVNQACIEQKILYQQKDLAVLYNLYKAPWPVSNREFITVAYTTWQGNKVYTGCKGCNFSYPKTKDIVRGQSIISGYILQRISQDKTKVTYISCADPKGSIPEVVKNQAYKRQGQTVVMLDQAMKKEKK